MEERRPSGENVERELSRLPRGRHGLPRELVIENQRERLIRGIIDAVAEHGYGATKIADIIDAAKLSRKTYYEQFSSKEECFLAAYDACLSELRTAVLSAGAEKGWSDRVRAGLNALLQSFVSDPALAVFFLIGTASAGAGVAERHHMALRELISDLVADPPKARSSVEPSRAREDALAGGISRIIVKELNAGNARNLEGLLPDLVELILRPYVGNKEAVRVAREK